MWNEVRWLIDEEGKFNAFLFEEIGTVLESEFPAVIRGE